MFQYFSRKSSLADRPRPGGLVLSTSMDGGDDTKLEPKKSKNKVSILSFVKSVLTVNPSMNCVQRVLLQGSDRVYVSTKSASKNVRVDCNQMSDRFVLWRVTFLIFAISCN